MAFAACHTTEGVTGNEQDRQRLRQCWLVSPY